MIMTQEEFDKAPLLDQILYDEMGMLVENHPGIAEAMEKYHQSKVKENELCFGGSVSDLKVAFRNITQNERQEIIYDGYCDTCFTDERKNGQCYCNPRYDV